MFFKTTRIQNRELLDEYHRMRCIVCNSIGKTVGHHIKSKGSGGPDERWNLMPLCFICHNEVHKIGLLKFSEKYKKVDNWLVSYGWSIHDFRWRHL